jgi:hypothetical protein
VLVSLSLLLSQDNMTTANQLPQAVSKSETDLRHTSTGSKVTSKESLVNALIP